MKRVLLLLFSACLLAASCSDGTEDVQTAVDGVTYQEDGKYQYEASLYEGALTTEEMNLAKEMGKVDAQVFSALLEGKDDNVVYSPYSLEQVVAMTLNGAGEETQQSVLSRYELRPGQLHLVNSLMRKVNRGMMEADKQVTIESANALWVNEKFPIYRSYATCLESLYDAEVKGIDCHSDKAGSIINLWASEKTHGAIDHVTPDGKQSWNVMLANAIYLNAPWVAPFQEKDTSRKNFTNMDGKEVEVDMMRIGVAFHYAKTEVGELLRVPIGSRRDFEVDFILPAEGVSDPEAMADLDNLIEDARLVMVDFELPRTNVTANHMLSEPLSKAGLGTLWQSGTSRISPRKDLNMGVLTQQVNLKFEEKGVVATAVTLESDISNREAGTVQEIIPFHLNRPFYFLIRHNDLNFNLFMGRISKM